MNDQSAEKLRNAIRDVAAKIQRFKDRQLGEQNTKATLIEPILDALGWDTRDPDEVYREYKPTSRDSPVDYALALLHDLKLFVEAKGLGGDLSDRKWIAQTLGYAVVAGVKWCVLTDGDEYRFYNATAAVDAEEKIFFVIRLSEAKEDEAVRTLGLISRDNLSENSLDALWTSMFVDRLVKECLKRMLETRDKGLLRLIRKRTQKLRPEEIAQSLRRLDFRIESPPIIQDILGKGKGTGRGGEKLTKYQIAGRKAAASRKRVIGVTPAALIAAGILTSPLRLFRNYKGHELEATLTADGAIEYQRTKYEACSAAAEHARETVTGKKMNTNGWVFWQFVDAKGRTRTLDTARSEYLALRKEQGE